MIKHYNKPFRPKLKPYNKPVIKQWHAAPYKSQNYMSSYMNIHSDTSTSHQAFTIGIIKIRFQNS